MNYKCGPFYVTVCTMKHPLFVFKDSASKHPVLVVALSITYKKEMEDYKFLAYYINGFVKDQLIYGTDGEIGT